MGESWVQPGQNPRLRPSLLQPEFENRLRFGRGLLDFEVRPQQALFSRTGEASQADGTASGRRLGR